MATRVYAIGHSDRPIGSFHKPLQALGIELLVDGRRFLGSWKYPQYGRDAMAASLIDAGIGYTFLREMHGGRRSLSRPPDVSPNGGLANPSFRNYAGHMLTPEFSRVWTSCWAWQPG